MVGGAQEGKTEAVRPSRGQRGREVYRWALEIKKRWALSLTSLPHKWQSEGPGVLGRYCRKTAGALHASLTAQCDNPGKVRHSHTKVEKQRQPVLEGFLDNELTFGIKQKPTQFVKKTRLKGWPEELWSLLCGFNNPDYIFFSIAFN